MLLRLLFYSFSCISFTRVLQIHLRLKYRDFPRNEWPSVRPGPTTTAWAGHNLWNTPIARAFPYTQRPRHPTNLKDPKMHNFMCKVAHPNKPQGPADTKTCMKVSPKKTIRPARCRI
jgi:hypothetical protein